MAATSSASTSRQLGDQPANGISTDPVTLNVGGRKFFTTIGTLVDRSEFFAAFFSGRWTVPKHEDGSIFIDADPNIFEHVLRYLRRGVFPLAFDRETGHDYRLYIEILSVARYFQIPMLEKWLADKCYIKCVEFSTTWRAGEVQSYTLPTTISWSSEFDTQLVKKKTSKRYNWVCPDKIWRDHGQDCPGCTCTPPKEGVINAFESTEWVEVGKKYTLNEGWCSDDGNEFRAYYAKSPPSDHA